MFKIHSSQVSKIMGPMGLTETQLATMTDLKAKDKRTSKQEDTLRDLIYRQANPELPQTAKTFLHEWYSGEREEIYSKMCEKGKLVENDCIDFSARMLGLGLLEKNEKTEEDDYMIGTCDVITPELIIDVKSPWNRKTFQSNINGINLDYDWQGQSYMHLYKRKSFILFYGLMDTPPEVNHDKEVTYSHLPDNERWIAYRTSYSPERIAAIIERVKMCREYLKEYEVLVKSKLGKIN